MAVHQGSTASNEQEVTPQEALAVLQVLFDGTVLIEQPSQSGIGAALVWQVRLLGRQLLGIPRRYFPPDREARVRFLLLREIILAAPEGTELALQRALKVYAALPGSNGNAVHQMREVLTEMADIVAVRQEEGLPFITDDKHRRSLLADWDSAGHLLNVGEYKASTVMSGSVIEALLVHGLLLRGDRAGEDLPALRSKLVGVPGTRNRGLPMHKLVAAANGLLREDTLKLLSDNVSNYRNLIHRGAELREGTSPDAGTAHIAYGAVVRVVRDLTALFA